MYLGLRVVLGKIRKMTRWKERYLYFAKSAFLNKYILTLLPTYYVSQFKKLTTMVKEMEKVQRKLLCG